MGLADFDGRHAGQDVWVVGSDASVEWFPDGFWDDRIVVGVNRVPTFVPSTYCVTKADLHGDVRSRWMQDQVNALPHLPHIVSRFPNGHPPYGASEVSGPNVVHFDHDANRVEQFDADRDIPDDPEKLLVSWSTLGSALHFAARLGARTVFVVGASGGTFGDVANLSGYKDGWTVGPVGEMSAQTERIAERLTGMYGTMFVMVLPWANLRCGGVPFRSDYGALN